MKKFVKFDIKSFFSERLYVVFLRDTTFRSYCTELLLLLFLYSVAKAEMILRDWSVEMLVAAKLGLK